MSWVNLNDLYATKSELATKVPTSRTINGKALSSNVTLAASDIKLSDSTTLQSAWDSISQTAEVNGLRLTKVGKLVCAEMYSKSIKLNGSWDTYCIGAIPDGFKPSGNHQVRQKVAVRDVDTNYSCAFWVNSSGYAYVGNFGGTGLTWESEMSVSCCWQTD